MAKVFQRVWRSGPRKVKRAAWGYTVQIDGKQERRFREEWTKEDAEKALAGRQLGLAAPQAPQRPQDARSRRRSSDTWPRRRPRASVRSVTTG